MKAATLLFYALVSFALGSILYVLAIPLSVVDRSGLFGLINAGILALMFGGPLVFGVGALVEGYRTTLSEADSKLTARIILLLVAGVLVLAFFLILERGRF